MNIKHIPVVLGTARTKRKSEGVARAVVDIIAALDGYSSELVDVREHVHEAVTVPSWGVGGANEVSTKWKEIVERSHALVIVTPEYNHSFPGELKLLLDSLHDSYLGKTVGLVGVSSGTLGAARVVDHIKPVLVELKLQLVKQAVHISKVGEAIAEDGTFANEKTTEYVEKMVQEISVLADALQTIER